MNKILSKGDETIEEEYSKIRKDCLSRFPAQKDKDLLMEVCRQDPKVERRINLIVGQWQKKVYDKVTPEIQQKFGQGLKDLLESQCKL